jgi:hypothetical protein
MRRQLRSHLSYANVTATIALFVALGGTTYAATGGNFILGQANTAGSTTALSSGTTGPAFKVTNTSTGTAGSFNAAAGHPALAVNTAAKVNKLNADLLDGKDSTNWKVTNVFSPDSDIGGSGPLPIERTYTSSGGKLLIMASGSGYRAATNANPGEIGMAVLVDGNPVGYAQAFTNEFNSHKAFDADFPVVSGLSAGTHTIRLEPIYDASHCGSVDIPFDWCTKTDGYDFFHISVIEIPF